jgi:hypothetical protein
MRLKLLIAATLFTLTSAVGVQPVAGATAQKITWSVIGDCVDEYDANQYEYLMYEGDECYFKVQVKPAFPARKVALQWFSDDRGKWLTENEKMTNKNGVAFLYPDAYDSDGYFYDGEYKYRMAAARAAGQAIRTSDSFYITFMGE